MKFINYDKHKKRFIASLRTSPIERIQNLEYDFSRILEATATRRVEIFIEFTNLGAEL